ncbi:MAG: alpha/beta hydrolase [Deltaproteobacteria bacterium]|jgi:acetyl esterase/lipase|nr:alpha/beta hydrolase [Deltaproteobacteria bacterium]
MKLWDEELEQYREEARNMLQFLPDIDATDLPEDPIARAEAQRASFAEALPPMPPSARAEASSIPGPAGDVPVRIFRPDGPARALFLHLHGGGWILGSPEMTDATNEVLAEKHGLAVVSVDYRLAPEHPYPAGPDDCEAALSWLLEKGPSEFGADRAFIGGESAGGHLTLFTGLRARDRLGVGERILGLNLVFGWYDLNGTPSQRGNGGVPDMLNPEGLRFMVESFTPGLTEEQRRDPDISPLFADLRGLPPCLISVGTGDHLCDDSLFLAPRLAAAEVDVELAVYPDSPHGYQSLPTKMADASAARIEGWIERVLKGAGL